MRLAIARVGGSHKRRSGAFSSAMRPSIALVAAPLVAALSAGCGSAKAPETASASATCPADMARVQPANGEPFCLDRAEVTVSAYAECVGKAACSALSPGRGCNRDDLATQQHPVNCVAFAEAEAYCAAQKKRLPTDAEWIAAAGSSLVQPDACWSGRAPRSGTCAVDASVDGLGGIPANVAEWTSTVVPALRPARSVRGGSFSSSDAAELRSSHAVPMAEDAREANIGFRCASALSRLLVTTRAARGALSASRQPRLLTPAR